MKKTLLALALGSLGTTVLAASQVTLYGKIDEGVMVSKARHGAAVAELKSGFTGSSRWGIKGTEDLGNGYSVGFILEQGFTVDDGAASTSGAAFSREASMNVKGGFGKLTFGRLGTLGFADSCAILRGAVFGVTYGASGWGTAPGNLHWSRVNNAVGYASPEVNGLSFHAMYSNQTSGDDDSDNKWSLNSHYYGLGVLYKSSGFNGSLIFEAKDNKDQTGDKREAQYHLTAGGYYQAGIFRPMAIYQYQWGKNYWKQHAFQIGSHVKLGGGTVKAGFKFITRKLDGAGVTPILANSKETKGNLWNLGAGYEYPFSKRTKVYGFAGYTDGGKGWDKGANLTKATYNGYQLIVGMVHDF